ncbi:MAG: 6-carboxytetrahydropterin synthase QueD [Planctomycetota bacterium]
MLLFREFTFDAAHRLDHLPEGHKCARIHGHTYRLKVWLDGEIRQPIGWVVDFAEIKAKTSALIDQLDHRMLNEVEGLAQPTTEHIAVWLWDRLKPDLPELAKIEVWENATSGVVYEGH